MTQPKAIGDELPAYARVKLWLREKIEEGDYRAGDRLPTQHELSKQLGVSRITIVRAIQDLEQEGLVERRQGVGTFVSKSGAPYTLTNVSLLYKQTFDAVRPVHRLVSVQEAVLDSNAAGDVLGHDEPLWYVVRLRLRDGKAVSYEESFIPIRRVPQGTSPEMLQYTLVHDFLTNECGIKLASTRVYIAATLLSREQTSLLGGSSNDPGLLITRINFDIEGQPVSFSLNTLPADVSSYFFEFRHDTPRPQP